MLFGKRVHAFRKKGACFSEKGCMLFEKRVHAFSIKGADLLCKRKIGFYPKI